MNQSQPVENAKVYCPMCTHTVEAEIQRHVAKHRHIVTPGQKCPHCCASLDAGFILPRPSLGVRAA
jgi:hypothetical protein